MHGFGTQVGDTAEGFGRELRVLSQQSYGLEHGQETDVGMSEEGAGPQPALAAAAAALQHTAGC